MSIVIINYGAGNLRSVQKAFEAVGCDTEITNDKSAIRGAKGVVLPGVGSFDAAINKLHSLGLEGIIEKAIALCL